MFAVLVSMRKFLIVWFGQLISLIGSAMTLFALTIWAYQQTGRAMTLALLMFSGELAHIIATPVAGALVDRWNRKRVMIVSDLLSGLVTVGLLILYSRGQLQIVHLYAANAIEGILVAFQLPAYTTATTMIVPREHYARASGMRSLAYWGSKTLAPVFAAALLPLAGIVVIMWIDLATFLVAVSMLLLVVIPDPPPSAVAEAETGNLLKDIGFALSYIRQRPGLAGLTGVFATLNLVAALTYMSILPAMILARSGGDQLALGAVESVMSLGGVLGGLALSVWGGPRRKIDGVLMGAALSFCLGDLLFAVGQSVPVWMVAGFASAFFIPFIIGGDRAIWQAKVPPDIQGRVISVSQAIRMSPLLVGYLVGGSLADRVFEPLMATGAGVSHWLVRLIGVGPGAGMGLMFLGTWFLGLTLSLLAYLFRPLREVELDLPDFYVEIGSDDPLGKVIPA